jgi:hypothetical protein
LFQKTAVKTIERFISGEKNKTMLLSMCIVPSGPPELCKQWRRSINPNGIIRTGQAKDFVEATPAVSYFIGKHQRVTDVANP